MLSTRKTKWGIARRVGGSGVIPGPEDKKDQPRWATEWWEGSGITSALWVALHLPVPFGMGGWGVLLGVGSGQTRGLGLAW